MRKPHPYETRKKKLKKLHDQILKQWKDNLNKEIPVISEDDVTYTVAKMTGIPLLRLEEKESEKLLRMEEVIHERIISQDEAIKAISRAIRRSRAGLKSKKKPIGSFFFLWPNRRWKDRTCKSACRVPFQ